MGEFIKKNLNWILGIFFLLASLGGMKESFIASILFFLISILFIPKTFLLIKNKIKFFNLEKYRYLIILFLFVLSGRFIPQIKYVNESNLSENKKIIKENIKSNVAAKKITLTPVPTLTLSEIPSPTQIPTPTIILYSVTKIVDGDTIDINIDGKTQRVRVIGINSPEVVDPRRTVECFGKEASDKAKSLLSGKKVRLERDITQGDVDKYQRLLRYIFLEDGTDFGLTMIKEGYAYEYTYNIPYKYQQQYKKAQKEAQNNKRGLWADNICITPGFLMPISLPRESLNTDNGSQQTDLKCQYSCVSPDRDCSDFKTQAEAQAFFNCCGFTVANDPMKLDNIGVGDGIVCESLH